MKGIISREIFFGVFIRARLLWRHSPYAVWVWIKVAYYSFQKRKITFLELKFKANRSFSFGSFVAITVKRNNINPHYPGKVIWEAKKISNITDRVRGGDWKLDFLKAFFAKSSRTTLPQFFRIWKGAINKQPCKRKWKSVRQKFC